MSVPRFWRSFSARYTLTGTKCEKCSSYFFPPRTLCPKCRREGKIVSYRFRGTGEVVTYSVVYSAHRDFRKYTPYIVGIIKLDEGAKITAQIACDPGEVKIGMRVRAAFRKIGEDEGNGIIYYGTKFVPE